ncbi:MAG: adenylate/guanylate cyclase domain-containing protein [Spirochaetia bacterium]|nr:adenylate/guanylate cyclase domain-containing protein [Spirochaetia bacterium]
MNTKKNKTSALSNEIISKCEFNYVAYDMYSGIQEYVQKNIRNITELLGRPGLSASLYTIAYELATNAMKAIYKQAFYKYLIHELGWSEIPYSAWLDIFKTEIATNKAENFAHVCRQNNLSVRISMKLTEKFLKLEVINSGKATDIEISRLNKLYKRSITGKNFEEILFEEDTTKEEDGLGIPLIILTLKGLKIPVKNFKLIVKHGDTIAKVDFPLSLFRGQQDNGIHTFNNKYDIMRYMLDIYNHLDYSLIVFQSDGSIQKIAGPILTQLGISEDRAHLFPSLLKAVFFEDIFLGPYSIENVKKFENYRLSIKDMNSTKEFLYNISGTINEAGVIPTLWQTVNVQMQKEKLAEGSIFDSIQLQKLIAPYIPRMILDKAHESIRKGLKSLPNEGKDVTVMFADMIGFTSRSQSMSHNQLIDLLNLVMGIVVHSIEKNSGYIDKFIGDGVMCVFFEPVSAILAAIEIQNNLFQLNEFREASGAEPLHMRIGMNSGSVILGSIGTKKRMDWTALGDVVNTASRIEKLSRKNSVLISNSTYLRVKDMVVVKEEINEHLRGKKEDIISLFFIQSVHVLKGKDNVVVSLFDENISSVEGK